MREHLIERLVADCCEGKVSFGQIRKAHGSDVYKLVRDKVVAVRTRNMKAIVADAVAANVATAAEPCVCDDPRNWDDFQVVEHLIDPLHSLSRTIDSVKCPKCGKTHDLYSAIDDLGDDNDY